MISLEQVQLLEERVSKAIEYVQRVTSENAALVLERAGLEEKLNANQKRIDELEVHIMRFKEDQGRIEDGIIAALDRLSQFEEAFENSLKEKALPKKPPVKSREKSSQTQGETGEIFFEIPPGGRTEAVTKGSETAKEEQKLFDDDHPSEGELDIF